MLCLPSVMASRRLWQSLRSVFTTNSFTFAFKPAFPVELRHLSTMDVQTDWERSIQKLLVSQRAASIDAVVFTQQKHASVFCKAYRHAPTTEERRRMLKRLISQYGRSTLNSMSLEPETDEKYVAEITRLLKDMPPPYQKLFRAIGQVEDGIKFLVDLRADVLTWFREMHAAMPVGQDNEAVQPAALKLMDVILRDLLSIWFSIGLLEVQRVTWKSPCDLLQRVAEYESVHPVRSWTDLKQRVGFKRRCFVFTHPSVPREPLVVLHVALMDRIPEKIAEVIASHRGEKESFEDTENLDGVNSAIFYSINSTQKGLQGIDLGHFLIKRVVQQLSAELPSLAAFSSLSPIPGFRRWLTEELRRRARGHDSHQLPLEPDEVTLLSETLEKNDWYANEMLREQLRPILLRVCAFYLLRLKHRGYAYDPVANFHLRNGAMLWRINWAGDPTTKGLNQSCSIMVNYRYYLNKTDENSRSYLDNKEIAAHEQVTNVLSHSPRSAL